MKSTKPTQDYLGVIKGYETWRISKGPYGVPHYILKKHAS